MLRVYCVQGNFFLWREILTKCALPTFSNFPNPFSLPCTELVEGGNEGGERHPPTSLSPTLKAKTSAKKRKKQHSGRKLDKTGFFSLLPENFPLVIAAVEGGNNEFRTSHLPSKLFFCLPWVDCPTSSITTKARSSITDKSERKAQLKITTRSKKGVFPSRGRQSNTHIVYPKPKLYLWHH